MRPRNFNIDAFRVLANLSIILVHTRPFMDVAFDDDVRFIGELINQFVRIATPFFFMASGYFFAASMGRGAQCWPLANGLIKRLGLFFVFWSLVYIFIPMEHLLQTPAMSYPAAVHATLSRAFSLKFLLNGGRVHLWFLPAMACALALLAMATRFRLERLLLAVAVLLYGIGLLGGAYKATPIGIDLGIGTRNGPFFSTLFVVSGYLLYRSTLELSVRLAVGLIGLGVALRIAEVAWIMANSPTSPGQIEYLLGTYPFGVGIFLLLLKTQGLGQLSWMVRLSRYSAGIYCAHMLFVDYFTLRPMALGDPLWEVVRPLVILGLSIALVVSMAKIPTLRPVVT